MLDGLFLPNGGADGKDGIMYEHNFCESHVVRAGGEYFPEEEAEVPEMWKVRGCWTEYRVSTQWHYIVVLHFVGCSELTTGMPLERLAFSSLLGICRLYNMGICEAGHE